MRWTGLFGAFSCCGHDGPDSRLLLLLRWQGRQDLNLQPSALETDALPLSYSPKELEYLATLRCGYSSAVLTEADVYLIAWNVARVCRKIRSVGLAPPSLPCTLALVLGACWSSTPPPAPLRNEAPRSTGPSDPEPLAAEFGTFDDLGVLEPAVEIPLFGGSAFGWRLQLGCTGAVAVHEQLRLPTAGDWGGDPEMTISADGKVATVRSTVPCTDGWIEKIWTVSPGDPPGVWVVRVTVEGFAPQTFRASFQRTPTPLPP